MLCRSVSLFLFTVLALTEPVLHAGSASDSNNNAGCRSGSPGSESSEGNDQYAVSQGSGGSSASSSARGASGSGSGSYAPRQLNTTLNRFDRAAMALNTDEPASTFTSHDDDTIAVHVLTPNFDTVDGYHRFIFRMNKLVDYFIFQTTGLPPHFSKIAYDDSKNRGYDMAIMHVDSPDLAGKATLELKRKVSAWLRTKIKTIPSH